MNLFRVKISFHFAVFLLCIGFSSALHAQSSDNGTKQSIQGYDQKKWVNIDNTPIERIWDIEQDDLGYLWIASDRGLLRYDGTFIKKYNLENVPIIETESIKLVKLDSKGSVWFSTNRSVFVLRNGQVKELLDPDGNKVHRVLNMFLDENEKLCLASSGKIYHEYNGTLVPRQNQLVPIYKVFKGLNGHHWAVRLGENHQEIYSFTERGALEIYNFQGTYNEYYEHIVEDKIGRLFIGSTYGHLYVIANDTLKALDSTKSVFRVRDIVVKENEEIWYTGDGVKKLKPNGEIENFNKSDGLSRNKVNCLFLDKDQNLWVGTDFGLNMFTSSPYKNLLNKPEKNSLVLKCVAEDSEEKLWVGTESNGLCILEKGNLKPISSKAIGKKVEALLYVEMKELWIGTPNGLFVSEVKNGELLNLDLVLDKRITLIHEDWKGVVYAVHKEAEQEILNIFEGKKVIHSVNVKSYGVSFVKRTKSDQVVLGTTKGLFLLQGDSLVQYSDNPFFKKYIFNGLELNDSSLWVGSYGSGLARLKGDSIDYLDTRNGLSRNNLQFIFTINGSTLWQLIPDGEKGKLTNFIPQRSDNGWSVKQGESFRISKEVLPLDGFGYVHFAYGKSGTLVFLTNYGVLEFNPKSINNSDPNIQFEQLLVSGEKIGLNQSIVIPSSAENFEFRFSSIGFNQVPSIEFEYKLIGYDNKWHNVGQRNVAYYSSLPAGDFEFTARLLMPSGNYITLDKPIVFSKKEYWYKTWGAYFAYVFGLVLIVGLIFQLRIRQVKAQRNKLQTIVNQKTAELKGLNANLEGLVEKRTEALESSKKRYSLALEASKDGIFDLDVASDQIKFSPSIYTMLGYEPFEFPENRNEIYKRIQKEDLRGFHENYHKEILERNGQELFNDEYRMFTKDGKTVWVQVKAKIVERLPNGKPSRIVGTHSDITSEKRKTQEMLEAVLKTEDLERSRISKDIHDGLQQTLTISSLNFQAVKKEISSLNNALQKKFQTGWDYLQESINDSRTIAHSLMPKAIIDFGVVSAFESLIDDVDKAAEETSFSFYHNFKKGKIDNGQIEVTLYRILQEAINNIVKYAEAEKVAIQLKDYEDIYMLTIEDDGKGFDMKTIESEESGMGFKSMKNRLEAINGFLEVSSFIGKGTTIIVEINKEF